ncbi:hypothetical protein evm_004404 [Chilo suppressalis]|nr:hypothetical protein evm_004404 [Chilo suppressalis]
MLQELQTEIESYKLQLDKYETEKKSNLENIQTLQELVDSLTEQKLNYITEVDTAQGKIKSLSSKCKLYEEEIKKFKADFIIKDKSLSDNAQKLSDVDSEIISLKRQNNRFMEENEQLITQLSELETQIMEFNKIGLEQRKQLEILEERVQREETSKTQIDALNKKVEELENQIALNSHHNDDVDMVKYENKMRELSTLYESEKSRNEKANVKLRSYKDKILKCATCINQLKNSRFILTKTIKEYSENVPKWQNDIIKASQLLENQINQLNSENTKLKEKLIKLEQQLNNITDPQKIEENNSEVSNLHSENAVLKAKINNLERLLQLENDNCAKHKSEVISLRSNCDLLQSQQFEIKEQLSKCVKENETLQKDLDSINTDYKDLIEQQLPSHIKINNQLTTDLNVIQAKYDTLKNKNTDLMNTIEKLKGENDKLAKSIQTTSSNNQFIENMHLQIKALESEKATLVKEKLNARDNVVELENKNKILTEQNDKLKSEITDIKSQLDIISKEKTAVEKTLKTEKENEISKLKCEIIELQEQYGLLKKTHEDLQDLNGLLKEEVENLKLSLEQPRPDDGENQSDLNVSLQADIVKLETKLAAYKQENASLLTEIKESRAKSKEFDNLAAECDDAKSKLMGYKTENTELLNEMKEINQVLKERGEAISKLQKAVAEMERLIETLEKDRDRVNQEKGILECKVSSLENDLKNAEENTNKRHNDSEQILHEKDAALKALSEKDTMINSLKDEIESLKHQQSSSDLPNEDMSTSTISKAEEHSRMRDLDDSFEEKYTKLRIFALKLKKKLNDTINQLQNAEQDKAILEKLLSENEKTPKSASKDEVDNVSNLQSKVQTLTETVAASEKIEADLKNLKAELDAKSQQLTAEIEAHKVTKENLEKARRDAKKKNVLSLEMEDYERSMKELTAKMEEKKKKMVQMESTIDTQEGTINAMKTQIKLLEEQIRSEEMQTRLTKEELQNVVEESRAKDSVIQMKNEVISKLEQDLEDEKRKNEEAILEITGILSEKEKIIISLGEEKIELNNKLKKLEFKCSQLGENLRITNIELADLKTEYTSYKVRAQAVLRQNQTVDHSQEEQLKEEAAALRAQIETLTAKLSTLQDQCAELTSESESMRRRAAEGANEVARAQQRNSRLQADLTRLTQELESERSQHKLQVSTLTQCYKAQINELEARLQKETDLLRKQLASHDNANSSQSHGAARANDPNRNQYMLPVIPKDDSDGEMDINVSMIPREEGEGSEAAPSPPPFKSYMASGGSGRSPVPLERLLEQGVPEDEALDAASLALTPEQEAIDLRRRLQAQQLKVKHVTVLLAESERECARMAQLSDLLKAELRRAHGSTQSAHNAEYMKNVTLKFITLPPGDERSRLVPVLQKILALSPEDTSKLQAVAKGLDPNPNKGWGSYLPWPGGK